MLSQKLKEAPAIAMTLAFLAIALGGIYLQFDRTVTHEEHIGVLESLHQIQGNTGSNYSVFYVRLSNGDIVNVTPLEHTPFVKGREVRLVKNITDAGRIGYSFGGYVGSASNPAFESGRAKSGAPAQLER